MQHLAIQTVGTRRRRNRTAAILPALIIGLTIAAAPGEDAPATAAEAEPEPWTLVTEEAAFSPRDSAKGCIFKDKMWLSNGYYHGNVNIRDLWNSTDGKTWNLVLEDTPYDIYAEIVEFKGKLWAIGRNSVWSSPDGSEWTRVVEDTPFFPAELFVFRGKMWVLSGSAVWTTDDGENWERLEGEIPLPRGAFAFAIYDDHLWIMGGTIRQPNDPPEKGYPNSTSLNDVWRSADGIAWEKVLAEAPWAPRRWFKAAAYDGRLWIFGGFDNVNYANFNDVWHTQDGKNWERFEPQAPWSERHEPTVFLFENSLYLVAGNSWPVLNDVWRLQLP